MATSDWVPVYSTTDALQATLVLGMLEANGVPVVSMNKKDQSYGWGEVELFTVREQVVRALHLINKQDGQDG
jgi:hypothetical protein